MKRKKQKVVLEGDKGNFKVDRVKKSLFVKRVKRTTIPFPKIWGTGRHGKPYNLLVFKGKHKVRLVIKKYRGSGKNQTAIAEKEFEMFQRLKNKGYHVPPTIRLVEIKGKKYVALTDLSRFGNVEVRYLWEAKAIVGEKAIEPVQEYVEKENRRAYREENMLLGNSWEYVIDTKKGTVKAFIIDLGWYSMPEV